MNAITSHIQAIDNVRPHSLTSYQRLSIVCVCDLLVSARSSRRDAHSDDTCARILRTRDKKKTHAIRATHVMYVTLTH